MGNNWQKRVSLKRERKSASCSPQSRQRESQGQAQPEGLGGGPEVEDEAVAGPSVGTRGHNPEEEHHGEETATTDGEVEQRGG